MWPENVKTDPDTGEPMIDPDTGEYIIETPEDKTGEKKDEKTPPEYTDEELAKMVEEEQAQVLKDAGLGKFKNFSELIEGYRSLDSSDKLVFPKIKALAHDLNLTPEQLVASLEEHFKDKRKKPEEKDMVPGKPSDRDMIIGRIQLDQRFERFQRKMEKQEIEIPDELQSDLEKLLPKILVGLTAEETAKIDPFEEAYELYLFKLSKSKSPEEVEKKLASYKAAQEKLKRQLKMPGKTPSKKVTAEEKERQEIWGDLDKLKTV
jgi:hypothetical protein